MKKFTKKLMPLTFAIFVGVILSLGQMLVLATDRYVDDDDNTCGGNSPCYSDIDSAISTADTGDTIYVLQGTYVQNLLLTKSINLIGTGKGETIIISDEYPYPPYIFTLSIVGNEPGLTGDILIEGFTFRGSFQDNPIIASTGIPSGISLTFRHNQIEKGYIGWVGTSSHGNFEFTDNIIRKCLGGMYLTAWDTGEVNIKNNEFRMDSAYHGPHLGLIIGSWNYVDCLNPYVIENNRFFGQGVGITIHGGPPPSGPYEGPAIFTDVTIANNIIKNIGYYGIWLLNSAPSGQEEDSGVHGTQIYYNGITGCDIGIMVSGDNEDTEVHYNQIYSNNEFGIKNSSSYSVNAENNWWGHINGPGWINSGGQMVSNDVDGLINVEPWLERPVR